MSSTIFYDYIKKNLTIYDCYDFEDEKHEKIGFYFNSFYDMEYVFIKIKNLFLNLKMNLLSEINKTFYLMFDEEKKNYEMQLTRITISDVSFIEIKKVLYTLQI